jgi:hypothetical protein
MPVYLSIIKVLAAVIAVGSSCAGLDVRYFLCVVEGGFHSRVIFVSLYSKTEIYEYIFFCFMFIMCVL